MLRLNNNVFNGREIPPPQLAHRQLSDSISELSRPDKSSRAFSRSDLARPFFISLDTHVSGLAIQKRVLARLKKLNSDPEVLYMKTLREAHGERAGEVNSKISLQIEKIGFKRTSVEEYKYEGTNPAGALRKFLMVRPLVLDCASSLHLLTHEALLDALGPEKYNEYIDQGCSGVLSINKQIPPRLPCNHTSYYTPRDEQAENRLPLDLKSGDRLWIQGPADGFAFHPASPSNAFNVLADTSTPVEPALVGFVSQSSDTSGRWSYDGMQKYLLKAYNAPLTLRDVSIIVDLANYSQKHDFAPHSNYTHARVHEWLSENQPEAFAEALEILEKNEIDLDQPTKLVPPQATSIRGVAQHTRARESLPFEQLISVGNNLTTVAPNPVIPPNKAFNDLIPGFETKWDHQRQICAVIDTFYARCTKDVASGSQGFHGAILYGQAGTGKTMACKAILQKLENEGHRVWQTDFSNRESLLTVEERMELVSLTKTKRSSGAVYDALIKKFAPEWDKHDILHIDDTNTPEGVLADVSNAALRYARQAGKKILITSNNDPIKSFYSSMTFPTDSIVLRRIAGPDYREAKSWHKNVNEADLQDIVPPVQIAGKSLTKNQKRIWQWSIALKQSTGDNGVAFYGPPGIGKTTVLKTCFPASETLWIEPHMQIADVDLRDQLLSSDARYLVIDDCNDPKGDHRYQKVLFELLNNESLVNKSGESVKVVLVSNREKWEDLVGDATSGEQTLSPRMKSRYHGRCASVALDPSQDFRASGGKRGVITQTRDAIISEGGYELSIAEYCKVYSKKQETVVKYYDRKRATRGFSTIPTLGDQIKFDDVFNEFLNVEKTALQKIETCSEVQLIAGQFDSENDIIVKPLIQQILDTMEAKPDYKVTIVSDNPEKTMQQLQATMKDVDSTGKYLSRLQRLAVE